MAADTKLWGIQAHEADKAWPRIAPVVRRAVERAGGRYSAEDIRAAIVSREMQAWVAWNGRGLRAFAVTQIVDYPGMRAARILLATGEDREDWLPHLATIEAWAKADRCKVIEAFARPGWERVLKDYAKTHVILEKRL